MEEITKDTASKKARNFFDKGFSALESNNLDYAIDMFIHCVELEPAFAQARNYLRRTAIKRLKLKRASKLGEGLTQISTKFATLKLGKSDNPIMAAEKLLKTNPLSIDALKSLAEAATAEELPEIGLQSYQIAREFKPDNTTLLRLTGDLYIELGDIKSGRECIERLAELTQDPEDISRLKDISANETIKSGYEDAAEKADWREAMKNKDEAIELEVDSKLKKTQADLDKLIATTQAQIEHEPANMNFRNKLARLFTDSSMFEEAIDVLEQALTVANDPNIEQTLSATRVKLIDQNIVELREAGQIEDAESQEAAKQQFIFDDLQERVKRYPNDLDLRYELGIILYDNSYIDEAIMSFQKALLNPQKRVNSQEYLAKCHRAKGQLDMARERLEDAASSLHSMDDLKKSILYELMDICSEMGDNDKASEYCKEIYKVDVSYRDIADRVQTFY